MFKPPNLSPCSMTCLFSKQVFNNKIPPDFKAQPHLLLGPQVNDGRNFIPVLTFVQGKHGIHPSLTPKHSITRWGNPLDAESER
jgi:hypothetical protein